MKKVIKSIDEFDRYKAELRAKAINVPWFSEPEKYPCLTFLYGYAEFSNDFEFFYLEDLEAALKEIKGDDHL